MKKESIFLLVALAVLLADAELCKSDLECFPICIENDDQDYPAIDANIVVWRDRRNASYDIYSYDLSTGLTPFICTATAGQYWPAVSGNIIVWPDERNGNYDIYGYNLSTQAELTICTNSANQYSPAVSGDIVVWEDQRNDWNYIYGYDIATSTEFEIRAMTTGGVGFASVDGNTVIWNEGGHNIYGKNLSTGSVFPIRMGFVSQGPSISGDIVVWQDTRDGSDDIYGYDLSASTEFEICRNTAYQARPAISGDIVVWEDYRNGNMDIYGYDISGHTEFSICTNSAHQGLPAVSGDIVVWQDNRNGNWDIYGARIPEIDPTPICLEHPTGDFNGDCKVDFQDFAIFCQSWLDCNLDIQEACWE